MKGELSKRKEVDPRMWDFGYDYEDDTFVSRYYGLPEKSARAMRREQEAIAAFDKAREDMEARIDLVPGETVVIELLKPICHLTSVTIKSFREYVAKFPGWEVRRRSTTEEERIHHAPGLKRKSYFINVLYTSPKKD